MDISRDRMLMLGGGLLVVAVLVGFGFRLLVSGGDDDGDETQTAVTIAGDEIESDEQAVDVESDSQSNDTTSTTDTDQSTNAESDGTSSSTTTGVTTSTTARRQDPSFVELSGLTLTRTGECRSLTVAVDSIISVASGGETTTFNYPDGGRLIEGTVTERSSFEVGEPITELVGNDWTVTVFSREHLAEGAYSENHSSPVEASGRYPGPAGMEVSYEITESNGQLTMSPLQLSASSDCQTVAPKVLISFSSPGGSGAADNGEATQMPANLGQPIGLLDPARFDLAEGWTMTVFVRDDWSGRSLSMTHDAPAQVTDVLAATPAGDPELTISYSVTVR